MLLEKQLPEQYWHYAHDYALDIYNNIPPTRGPRHLPLISPNKRFYGKNDDMIIYKIFACRACAKISKSKRRKNHSARSIEGIFVGLDRTSYPGIMVYSLDFLYGLRDGQCHI